MATSATPDSLAGQARRLYSEELVKGLVPLVQATMDGARALLDKPSEHAVFQRRRDIVQSLLAGAQAWHRAIVAGLRQSLLQGGSAAKPGDLPQPGAASAGAGSSGSGGLSLVPDDTIELEIVTSRLALAIMDRASWEFADLRSRIAHLEGRAELDAQDMLRAHVLSRVVFDAWRAGGQTLDGWRELQPMLHDEFALLVEEAYHETNRWLMQQGVLADVDLRPFIRRSRTHVPPSSGWQFDGSHPGGGAREDPGLTALGGAGAGSSTGQSGGYTGWQAGSGGGPGSATTGSRGSVGEETRMMTRAAPLARSRDHAEAVLGRLNRLIGRSVPDFVASTRSQGLRPPPVMSPGLDRAIEAAQQGLRQRLASTTQQGGDAALVTAPVLLEELHQRKQALKKAAASPEERATIEIVALLFQSILTEERIPASVRVWFARLQMPVLRVAVTEPDFFATIDHPARRLIDRMGACVMGFDSAGGHDSGDANSALEKEIKRIVQVVEAYPDTGRRVFQTVLTEFEKFLEHYFSNENEATKRGVSLAQQVEQRETLAIQYTIELRRMLNEVPVQEGVRQFLFHVWADVLATTAVRYGNQGGQTKVMKRAAADLIWSASAKVSREERAEVIRRLPLLLKSLREGMASAGMDSAQAGRAHPAAEQLAGRGLHGQGRGDPRRPPARTDGAPGNAGRAAARAGRCRHRRIDGAGPVRPPERRAGSGAGRRLDADAGDGGLGARTAGRQLVHARPWRSQRSGAAGLAWPAQAAVAVRHAAGPLRAVPAAPAGVLPAGRPDVAGAGRSADGARHAQRAGQAGRRRFQTVELTVPWSPASPDRAAATEPA